MTVHLDISQLLLDPRRTGIQRAERELIRHWPYPGTLKPCRFDASTGELHALPDEVLGLLCDHSASESLDAEKARLAPLAIAAEPVYPERLLCAELFSDPARAAYYRRQAGTVKTYWLVYDFLPWLHPNWFNLGAPTRMMPYLHALRSIGSIAFISAATKRDYVERISRRAAAGPIIPMGGDGLALERQTFNPNRRSVVMLGTVERRKNAAPAMRAFRMLWDRGVDLTLTMIGALDPDAPTELSLVDSLKDHPNFRHFLSLNDEGVRDCLRSARALLFPSAGEGYGIPPMEALHAGIPAIVSSTLPALADAPSHGQIRLDDVTEDTIAGAIMSIADDDVAAALWRDAAAMTVPGWAEFGRAVGDWVQRL